MGLLDKLGLGHIVSARADLDRTLGTLPGGKSMLLALTAELLAEPLATYEGALVAASHDLPFRRGLAPTRWIELWTPSPR